MFSVVSVLLTGAGVSLSHDEMEQPTPPPEKNQPHPSIYQRKGHRALVVCLLLEGVFFVDKYFHKWVG